MFFQPTIRSYTMHTSVIKHTSETDAYYIQAAVNNKRYISRFDFNSEADALAAATIPFTLTNYVFTAYIN